MKKLLTILLVSLFCISCNLSLYTIHSVSFKEGRSDVKIKFKMIKSIYKTKVASVKLDNLYYGSEVNTSFYYSNIFNDSSLLYCTCAILFEQNYNPNAMNIKKSVDSTQYKYRFNRIKFENIEAVDTLELSGVDSNGMYWKDIYLNCSSFNNECLPIGIGYNKVSSENKAYFDECLESFIIEFKTKKQFRNFSVQK